MNGPRRHPRFLLPDAWCGTLQLSEHVVLEGVGNHEVSVLSLTSARPGEEFMLELPGAALPDLSVVVLDSTPVVIEAGLRHRLRLRVQPYDHSADNRDDSPGLPAPVSGNPKPANDLASSEGDA